MRGRDEGQLLNGFFQGHGLLLSDPVAQQMGLQRRIHDLRHVSSGVGEGDDRMGVLHHL